MALPSISSLTMPIGVCVIGACVPNSAMYASLLLNPFSSIISFPPIIFALLL